MVTARGVRRAWRLVVLPLAAGLLVGGLAATLPKPWSLVVLALVFICAVVTIVLAERDIRRARREIAEFVRAYNERRAP